MASLGRPVIRIRFPDGRGFAVTPAEGVDRDGWLGRGEAFAPRSGLPELRCPAEADLRFGGSADVQRLQTSCEMARIVRDDAGARLG